MAKPIYRRDEVFVAGGLPTVTYVDRRSLKLEEKIERAIAKPHHFASITGTSKAGKTVLLHSVIETMNFVGVDGGQVRDVKTLWLTIADRLSQPSAVTVTTEASRGTQKTGKFGVTAKIPYILDLNIGAALGQENGETTSTSSHKTIDIQNACGDFLLKNGVVLVIDDFHYIKREEQTEILRNLKNLVFNGLKVVLLSVPYRAYEAIQAEVEITGRFVHVNVPEWAEGHCCCYRELPT